MSLTRKVINRKKFKKPNRPRKKSNRFKQEKWNILRAPLQRTLVPKKRGRNGIIKMDMGRGDRYTDEAGIYLDETSSPSRIQMRDSNLKPERCQMQRGAAKGWSN